MIRGCIVAGAALTLVACVSVLPEAAPPPPRYVLASAGFAAAGEAQVAWSLGVDDPAATRAYDTTKIALARAPGRIEYYAGGEWADRAPRLFLIALVRSFENSGRILSVGDLASSPSSDFILRTDIRAMHADYTSGRPIATVSVYAKLMSRRGEVYAARLFEHAVAVDDEGAAQVASAFDQAISALLSDIVEWTFAEAETVRAERG
ncbi:ABC-type transport auxiliary lipoprotein family protein [Amphiplicatus metriothermophilus]|uniref:Cholesterol transport system auxiliary component n=1 Tax=Amphiplicatus metriothermophilus TaxID=1519374 RepID=A0A239PQ80_9PROT|nr:ABC-type transport auxiliary lipoprotein family protein [Amphiplicatus metriothermophilus]MBB5518386.1 cholesterol transport system auxiliary component [Amphiplicatus metriothermophilus]SNT72449.1 cholesterol transport system auxiliary component [Amphiplicatus metriothermophilus]